MDTDCECPRCLSIKERVLMTTYGSFADDYTNLNGKYIVWGPSAAVPPQRTYASRPDAIKVAHMMSSKHPGKQFAVCKIVGASKAPLGAKYESFED